MKTVPDAGMWDPAGMWDTMALTQQVSLHYAISTVGKILFYLLSEVIQFSVTDSRI